MISRIDLKFFKMAVGVNSIGKETDNDISARCPHCSSDDKWKHTKRLHLYEKNGITNINCFTGDCDVTNKNTYSYLRDFHPSLLEQYKRENFTTTMEKLATGDDVFSSFKKEKPQETADILVHDLTALLKPIEDVPEALEYLDNRLCTYDEQTFGKWYYGFQDLKIGETTYPITNSIIIPLYYNKVMYGFYSRNIYQKDFYTYNPEHNVGFKVWNWFNVNKDEKVYIYEGIFDAISGGHKNCIALMGAKIPDDRLKELKQPVFVLDNDKVGLQNSLQYCKNHLVYIQPEHILEKDMNQLKINNPEISPSILISNNLYSGISAEVRIKEKL